jgi:hypothetical protein
MIVLVSAAILLPWAVRGLLLSGFVTYPVAWTRVPYVEWSLTAEQAAGEMAWIQSWAREPGVAPEKVLANWDWLPGWFSRFQKDEAVRLMGGTTLVGLALMVAGAAARLRSRLRLDVAAYLVPDISPLAGIVYWFLSAPDLRFGVASLWSVALICVAAGLWSLRSVRWLRIPAGRAAVFALALGLLAAYSVGVPQPRLVDRHALLAWPEIPNPVLKAGRTAEGFRIFVPEDSDQCWNTELACTPHFWNQIVVRTDGGDRPVLLLRRQ